VSNPQDSYSETVESIATAIAKEYFPKQPPEKVVLSDEAGEKMVWWWRVFHSQEFREGKGLVFHWFKQELERSAYLYELGARVSGEYEFGKCWAHLPQEKWEELAWRWPMNVATRYGVSHFFDNRPPEKGWTHSPPRSYNLRLNDTVLVRLFRRWIAEQRKLAGIPNPRPNEGKRNRGISWRSVELLDLRTHAKRILNDSERSQVAKAKQELKKLLASK